MEIILLEKVDRLGGLGDIVQVRAGYARNYLIPSGKAKYATKQNREEVQAHRAELEGKMAEMLAAAEGRRTALEGLRVTVRVETNQDGRLFGSVGTSQIAQAVTEAGPTLERQEVRLPEGPLHTVGEHSVQVHLHADVEATIIVQVESSGVIETPPELEEVIAEVTEPTEQPEAAPAETPQADAAGESDPK